MTVIVINSYAFTTASTDGNYFSSSYFEATYFDPQYFG